MAGQAPTNIITSTRNENNTNFIKSDETCLNVLQNGAKLHRRQDSIFDRMHHLETIGLNHHPGAIEVLSKCKAPEDGGRLGKRGREPMGLAETSDATTTPLRSRRTHPVPYRLLLLSMAASTLTALTPGVGGSQNSYGFLRPMGKGLLFAALNASRKSPDHSTSASGDHLVFSERVLFLWFQISQTKITKNSRLLISTDSMALEKMLMASSP